MNATNAEIINGVIVAAATAVAIALVLWIAKMFGRWFTSALARSFGEQVVDVMAPDMARLGNRLGQAIDELRVANTNEHNADQARLASVEHRLAAVESKLGMRPQESRTRVTDKEIDE
jgi:hypothetical protein